MDIDDKIPDMERSPKPASTSEKPYISDMEKDLPKWKEVGKMTDSQVDWWKKYLKDSRKNVESRQAPKAPTTLPSFHNVNPPSTVLDGNINLAIESHMARLDRSSSIRVGGRRIR